MALASPAESPGGSATLSQVSQPISQPVSTPQARRLLQREGAMILLSPVKQALQDAMLRSSPPPEQALGKRTHDEQDGGDTEPDEDSSVAALAPSLSNVASASLRYATHKKLRPEQRDELEAFLQVSASLTYFCPSV